MPPSWIVAGCLTGRGLVQRRPIIESKMAAKYENVHLRAQNTPVLQATQRNTRVDFSLNFVSITR